MQAATRPAGAHAGTCRRRRAARGARTRGGLLLLLLLLVLCEFDAQHALQLLLVVLLRPPGAQAGREGRVRAPCAAHST